MTESCPLILIIEDDPDLNQVFCKYIRAVGLRAASAHNLAEARAALGDDAMVPAAVVLDLTLGDEPGVDLLAVLQEPRFTKTHVVVVSGKAYDASTELGGLKADYVLQKPVSPRGLTTLLKSLVL